MARSFRGSLVSRTSGVGFTALVEETLGFDMGLGVWGLGAQGFRGLRV